MTTTQDLIGYCQKDLDRIADMIPWAHTDAYNPTNAKPEKPINPYSGGTGGGGGSGSHEVALAPPEDAWRRCPRCGARDVTVTEAGKLFTVGDYVLRSTCNRDGCHHVWTSRDRRDHTPTRDTLDIGSSTSRRAWCGAVIQIHAAELAIGTAWWTTVATAEPARMPRRAQPLASSPVGVVMRAIRNQQGWLAEIPAVPLARPLVKRAAANLDTAWRTLNGAFTIGAADPDTQARSTKDTCKICGIRDREDGCGGRCYTCKTYRTRRGHERPTDLDSVDDARQAQERRQARGEGYGEG